MKNTKKYIYLLFFIVTLITIGFGLIVLSPNVISIILSIGYILFFTTVDQNVPTGNSLERSGGSLGCSGGCLGPFGTGRGLLETVLARKVALA